MKTGDGQPPRAGPPVRRATWLSRTQDNWLPHRNSTAERLTPRGTRQTAPANTARDPGPSIGCGLSVMWPDHSPTLAPPKPRAEPYCNFIDDGARPITKEDTAAPRGAVSQVQCLINSYSNQSVDVAVDEVLGPRTRAAIRTAQRRNQVRELPGTIVGLATWDVLYNPLPNRARQSLV